MFVKTKGLENKVWYSFVLRYQNISVTILWYQNGSQILPQLERCIEWDMVVCVIIKTFFSFDKSFLSVYKMSVFVFYYIKSTGKLKNVIRNEIKRWCLLDS